ncbi:MAG: glutathione S-transferase [Maricaulis sp.]|nr:glutathione S-transferase [Maricaulis sp.]HAQ35328.1 glutathione S-transferase family protein [Alphaproteobacteria bacterium]
MTDLVLYHAPQTRSIRVRWALEEMGLDYRIEPVQFKSRPAGDEAFAKISPLRKLPAFRDGAMTMTESNAILQYLLGKYGPSDLEVKPDEADYGRYLQFLHFGEGGMTMPVSLLLAHTALLPEDQRNPALAKWAKIETGKLLDYLADHGLDGRDWLAAGRFTAADISVVYMLYLLKIIRQFDAAPEILKVYFARATGRDAWKKASAD